MKKQASPADRRAHLIDEKRRKAAEAAAEAAAAAGSSRPANVNSPRGKRAILAAKKSRAQAAAATAPQASESGEEQYEDQLAGSGSQKYDSPGTTDWTGEGRPDHERR